MSSEAMPNTSWAIRAEGLSKNYQLYSKPHHRLLQSLWRGRRQYYREFSALDAVGFELQRGQTLGIIGRNGAGKSTLLQIICGTLTPSAGHVQVQGRIAALLELGTGFNPEFTGRENVYVNAAIHGLSQAEIEQRLDDIIAFADIGRFIDQPVKTYSSGMYVRLAFAVVVHVQPDILIVDEALAVGDALFQAKCMTRMRRMLDDGVSLLFTSHDIAAIKALCHRTLWLEGGRMKALGDTAEVTRAYDQDWIRQANAAQGQVAAEMLTSTASGEGAASAHTGTGAVQLLVVGWGTHGLLATEARAHYGESLEIQLRLRVQQPCSGLVVSYHIKNRQNQHLLGGHSASHPELYSGQWQPGQILDLGYTLPVHLHHGDYALTVVVASMQDTEHYTDAVFHLWADDVATLHVMPRALFPLSDQVEPPVALQLQSQPPWVVLDDFFPTLLTGFRVAEYNAHLETFGQLQVLSTLGHFEQEHAQYAALYPQHASRVRPYNPEWLAGCQLAYLNFLNNAAHFLPDLERYQVPFVLTLYPGGGFGLDEPESDAKLRRVLASPWLKAIIVTQPVTEDGVRRVAQLAGLPLPPLHRIHGLVVNPRYFGAAAPVHGARYGQEKAEFDICFVAERYMAQGANKGYPEFVAAALALADLPQLRFHVVGGGYSPEEIEVSALGGRLQFHGRLETSALAQFYTGMDLIVSPNLPGRLHPGNFDGFPTGCCVEASLSGVAVMATDALVQNPGYQDEQSMFLLPSDPATLSGYIATRIRALAQQPEHLAKVALAGQAISRRLYHPSLQIGQRQQILRDVAHALT